MQPVLQVELAVPLDHVREEVAEERGVLVEESGQLEGVLVVISSSSLTCRGGSAAQSRGASPWSG